MESLNPQEPNNIPVVPVTPPSAPDPTSTSGAGHVDIGKILLPKKEIPGHTVDSAQRINAGALLEQEIAARVEGTAAQKTPEQKAADTKPTFHPAPAADESIVKPVETYQRDIESVVQNNNVSVLSIATAEANRRSGTSIEERGTKQKTGSFIKNTLMIVGGIIFLAAASGALAYLVTRPTSVPLTNTVTPLAPFIQIDDIKEITVTPSADRSNIMSSLVAAKLATSLSLGLISRLYVTEGSSTASNAPATFIPAQDFMTKLAPNIPAVLARSFEPNYLLGVHVYNDNQPFIILHVYSYEEAYSGMLAWEPFLKQDLSPLFTYKPTDHIPEQGIASTTTDTNGQFIQTGFVDKIIENHDARVLQNNTGDVYLLWTFIDRNTLVITTNDATLREILSRLKNAPVTPIPGQ